VRHPTVAKGGSNTIFTFTGTVNMDQISTPLVTSKTTKQDNAVALQRPVPVTLALSGLASGFQASASNSVLARKDMLLVFDNTTTQTNKAPGARKFFMVGANWIEDLTTSFIDANSFVLDPSAGFVIRKATTSGGAPSFWVNTPNYSN